MRLLCELRSSSPLSRNSRKIAESFLLWFHQRSEVPSRYGIKNAEINQTWQGSYQILALIDILWANDSLRGRVH